MSISFSLEKCFMSLNRIFTALEGLFFRQYRKSSHLYLVLRHWRRQRMMIIRQSDTKYWLPTSTTKENSSLKVIFFDVSICKERHFEIWIDFYALNTSNSKNYMIQFEIRCPFSHEYNLTQEIQKKLQKQYVPAFIRYWQALKFDTF